MKTQPALFTIRRSTGSPPESKHHVPETRVQQSSKLLYIVFTKMIEAVRNLQGKKKAASLFAVLFTVSKLAAFLIEMFTVTDLPSVEPGSSPSDGR